MLNEELVRKLAHGDPEAIEKINPLPITVQMSYGLAVDELRRKENIVPMSNGMEIYVQPKQHPMDYDAVGEALKQQLEEQKAKDIEKERIRREHAEKVAKQAVDRARAGLMRYE
ncbi:hypothetical protein [Mesobacillus zeae]|uniref:hypothetical protein n=1 Tax=Mesobacillus zeae TaxID=1917180 RepID=UPI003008E672